MQLLGLSLRPLIKHAHALADRQPDAGPVLDRTLEDATRLVQAVVEVAPVRVEWIVGFFGGPVVVGHLSLFKVKCRVNREVPIAADAQRAPVIRQHPRAGISALRR